MKVTVEQIESLIQREVYFNAGEVAGSGEGDPMNVLTICVLTLVNGFTVTGESACVDPANYDRELGESIARKNAVEKIWMLEGYLLKHKLQEK